MIGKIYLNLLENHEKLFILKDLKQQNYSENLVLNKKFNTFTDLVDLIDFRKTDRNFYLNLLEKYEPKKN